MEVEWLDFVSGEDFRAGVGAALALGQQHAVRGWINNARRMRAVRAADQAWYEAEAAPRLRALPRLAYLALVESDSAMNRMAVADLTRRQPPVAWPFAYATFGTIAEARAWVRAGLQAA